MTNDKDKLANHTPNPKDKSDKKNSLKNLDNLLNIDQVIGDTDRKEDNKDAKKSDGDHPFDLSFVHSQMEDYPDLSDDEHFPT